MYYHNQYNLPLLPELFVNVQLLTMMELLYEMKYEDTLTAPPEADWTVLFTNMLLDMTIVLAEALSDREMYMAPPSSSAPLEENTLFSITIVQFLVATSFMITPPP